MFWFCDALTGIGERISSAVQPPRNNLINILLFVKKILSHFSFISGNFKLIRYKISVVKSITGVKVFHKWLTLDISFHHITRRFVNYIV